MRDLSAALESTKQACRDAAPGRCSEIDFRRNKRTMSEVKVNLLPMPGGTRKSDPTLPIILEFQQPSSAIINAEVPRAARGTVWIVSSMVFALVLIAGI